MDDPIGPVGCLFWPAGSLRQWVVALAVFAALLGGLYLLLSWVGL